MKHIWRMIACMTLTAAALQTACQAPQQTATSPRRGTTAATTAAETTAAPPTTPAAGKSILERSETPLTVSGKWITVEGLSEASNHVETIHYSDDSYISQYQNGQISVEISRLPGVDDAEQTVREAIIGIYAPEGEVSVARDDAATERLSYPVWKASYESGSGADAQYCQDYYVQTGTWDFCVHFCQYAQNQEEAAADFARWASNLRWVQDGVVSEPQPAALAPISQLDQQQQAQLDTILTLQRPLARTLLMAESTDFEAGGQPPADVAWLMIQQMVVNPPEGMMRAEIDQNRMMTLEAEEVEAIYQSCFASGRLPDITGVTEGLIEHTGSQYRFVVGEDGDLDFSMTPLAFSVSRRDGEWTLAFDAICKDLSDDEIVERIAFTATFLPSQEHEAIPYRLVSVQRNQG